MDVINKRKGMRLSKADDGLNSNMYNAYIDIHQAVDSSLLISSSILMKEVNNNGELNKSNEKNRDSDIATASNQDITNSNSDMDVDRSITKANDNNNNKRPQNRKDDNDDDIKSIGSLTPERKSLHRNDISVITPEDQSKLHESTLSYHNEENIPTSPWWTIPRNRMSSSSAVSSASHGGIIHSAPNQASKLLHRQSLLDSQYEARLSSPASTTSAHRRKHLSYSGSKSDMYDSPYGMRHGLVSSSNNNRRSLRSTISSSSTTSSVSSRDDGGRRRAVYSDRFIPSRTASTFDVDLSNIQQSGYVHDRANVASTSSQDQASQDPSRSQTQTNTADESGAVTSPTRQIQRDRDQATFSMLLRSEFLGIVDSPRPRSARLSSSINGQESANNSFTSTSQQQQQNQSNHGQNNSFNSLHSDENIMSAIAEFSGVSFHASSISTTADTFGSQYQNSSSNATGSTNEMLPASPARNMLRFRSSGRENEIHTQYPWNPNMSTTAALDTSNFRNESISSSPVLDKMRKGYSSVLSPVGNLSSRLLASPSRTHRKIAKGPFKVLDAPSLQDDFYLNLIDWSSSNVLAVGLGTSVYLWSACTNRVTKLCTLDDSDSVTSVSWNKTSSVLSVGTDRGDIRFYDALKGELLRVVSGHLYRIGTMAWNSSNLLASGSRDKSILLRDIRDPCSHRSDGAIKKLVSHKQEVCGLKWSPDEGYLASGGNDNKLLIWSAKEGTGSSVVSPGSGFSIHHPIYKFSDHQAAVKAIAWSPHTSGLVASGGGTADRCIRFWNASTGTRLNSIDTGSQVCNLSWSNNVNEIVSTHGYSLNQIIVWKYPSMSKVATLQGHTQRVIYLAVSPDGQTICTGAGDESLRYVLFLFIYFMLTNGRWVLLGFFALIDWICNSCILFIYSM